MLYKIRPIEAIYLLSLKEKEEMSPENLLTATLGYLSNENFIKYTKKNSNKKIPFKTTRKNKILLRKYEKDLIEKIEKDEHENLIFPINSFDFKEYLTKRGFFKQNNPTKKYEETLNQLMELRMNLLLSTPKERNSNPFFRNMIYAFPSTPFYTEGVTIKEKRNIEDIVNSIFP